MGVRNEWEGMYGLQNIGRGRMNMVRRYLNSHRYKGNSSMHKAPWAASLWNLPNQPSSYFCLPIGRAWHASGSHAGTFWCRNVSSKEISWVLLSWISLNILVFMDNLCACIRHNVQRSVANHQRFCSSTIFELFHVGSCKLMRSYGYDLILEIKWCLGDHACV